MPSTTQENLRKSKSYAWVRYSVVTLLILMAVWVLISAWYLSYRDGSVTVDSTGAPIPLWTSGANSVQGEFHRPPSDSLYQADLAFGIISIIIAITILGSRKQPFNLVMLCLGIAFLIVTIALASLSFDTVVLVRVFVPATVAGV